MKVALFVRFSTMLHGDGIPKVAVIPGMANRWSLPTEEGRRAATVESLRRMTEKIVRGIFYIEEQKFIELPYVIDFFVLPEDAAAPWSQALDRFGSIYSREPGMSSAGRLLVRTI